MKLLELKLEEITIPEYRLRFQTVDEDLDDLIESIRSIGLLNPILVRWVDDGYELVSGSRRLRALEKMKKTTVLALVIPPELNPLVVALALNILQVELSPLERAWALLEASKAVSAEELGKVIGRSPGYIKRHISLLEQVNPRVIELLRLGELTFGHVEALRRLADPEQQLIMAEKIMEEQLNVNEAELEVDRARPEDELNQSERELNRIEREIISHLGQDWRTRVGIRQGRSSEKLVIEFFNRAQLEELLNKLSQAILP